MEIHLHSLYTGHKLYSYIFILLQYQTLSNFNKIKFQMFYLFYFFLCFI